MMITLFISACFFGSLPRLLSEALHGRAYLLPVLGDLAELLAPLGRELVVLPRRAGLGLLPLVVHELLAPHLAEEGVERPLLGRELRSAQLTQDVRDVDLVRGDDLEDEELEEALPDGRELFVDARHDCRASYLVS